MSAVPPDLHMLNLIVGDMTASLEFYRRLGIPVPDEDSPGMHVQLRMPGGLSLELDTAQSAQVWHAGWRADPASARVVIGFSFASRDEVDERYEELTQAGYRGRQPPFDAFWGSRYTIVSDRSSLLVGTSPRANSPDRTVCDRSNETCSYECSFVADIRRRRISAVYYPVAERTARRCPCQCSLNCEAM